MDLFSDDRSLCSGNVRCLVHPQIHRGAEFVLPPQPRFPAIYYVLRLPPSPCGAVQAVQRWFESRSALKKEFPWLEPPPVRPSVPRGVLLPLLRVQSFPEADRLVCLEPDMVTGRALDIDWSSVEVVGGSLAVGKFIGNSPLSQGISRFFGPQKKSQP